MYSTSVKVHKRNLGLVERTVEGLRLRIITLDS